MRVLIADKLSPRVADRLEAAGCAVSTLPALKGAALTEALRRVGPAVLVVRSTKVEDEHLDASRDLALIIRAGAGTNTIDVDGASSRGIYVSNCPGRNAVAVAELAIGHLVNLDRRIADNVAALRNHRWQKAEFGKARGLHGRTLAVLGTGAIGQEVIVRAKAFGMKIRAWSRSLTPERAAALGIEYAASPLLACRGADALTVHLALSTETRGLVGRELFDALAPGAYFINTSRGECVDQAALIDAMRDRGVRAGLDVFADEPSGGDAPFPDAIADEPNLYGTHHIGASTEQAEDDVGDAVVDIIEQFLNRGTVANCVNLATETLADHLLVVRHADKIGVLAGVLDHLRVAGVNVQEMENIIFRGAKAACARLQISGTPTQAVLDGIAASPDIFATSLVSLED